MRASKSLNPDQELESAPTVSSCGHMPRLGILHQQWSSSRSVCSCILVYLQCMYESHVCVCVCVLPYAWRVGSCGQVCAESSGPAGSPAARQEKRPKSSFAEGTLENKSAALAIDWCASPAADHTVTTAPTTGIETERKRKSQVSNTVVSSVFG